MNVNIDNKRQGAITLATVAGSSFTLKPGLNEAVPHEVVKDNESYLEALHADGDITVVSSDLPTVGEDAVTFVAGDPVLDDNGEPTFDEDGNAIVYAEDGSHVIQE